MDEPLGPDSTVPASHPHQEVQGTADPGPSSLANEPTKHDSRNDDGRDADEFHRIVTERIQPLSEIPGVQVDYPRLVDLTVKTQYEELRQLVFRLKNTGIAVEDRPRHIIQYATEARTALIKLLVLLRWKVEADVDQTLPDGSQQGRVSLAPGLDQWQDAQNMHNREVRNQLKAWAEDLKRFQLQAPDLETSRDLLVTGDFQRNPRYLDETYIPPPPLTAAQRLDTLERMNRLIKFRLQIEEQLPSALKVVDVKDGKLYLTSPGLFNCTMTVGTVNPEKQWLFSDLEFLSVDEPHLSAANEQRDSSNRRPAIPQQVKLMLCETLDNVLGGMYEQRLKEEERLEKGQLLPRQKTFCKIFNIIQLLCLSHRVETFYRQAKHLEASEWAGNLRVKMAGDRKGFTMTYWSRPNSTQAAHSAIKRSQQALARHGGVITVQIAQAPSIEDDVLFGEDNDVDKNESLQHELRVAWTPQPGWLGLDNAASAPAALEPTQRLDVSAMQTSGKCLDAEGILLDIVSQHSFQVITSLQKYITNRLVPPGLFSHGDIVLPTSTSSGPASTFGPEILLRLYDERWLKLQISNITGQLVVGGSDPAIIAAVQSRSSGDITRFYNVRTEHLIEIVVHARTILVREAVAEKLRFLGADPVLHLKGVPMHQLDAHHLASTGPGQPMRLVLHAALPFDPNKALLFAFHSNSIVPAIVHFGVAMNPNTGLPVSDKRNILDMEWLDVLRLPLGGNKKEVSANEVPAVGQRSKVVLTYDKQTKSHVHALSFELSLDDLQMIFLFCNALLITRSLTMDFASMGINALPEPQDTTFKLLSSATLQRGMSTRLRFVTKDFLPLKQVQDMVGSTFSVTIERGSGANIQDTRIVTRLDLQPLVAPADLVNGTAPQSSSLSSPPPQRTGSVSCQQDASVTGAIWSVKLDSRPLTTSFLAETSLCNGYAAHLMNEFVRLGHLLQLVAELKRSTTSNHTPVARLVSLDLTGLQVAYWPGHTLSIGPLWNPTESLFSNARRRFQVYQLDVRGLNDSETKARVLIMYQSTLERMMRHGGGLTEFLNHARLVAPVLDTIFEARQKATSKPELVFLTESRCVLLWTRAGESTFAYGICISFVPAKTGPEWDGGYIITDASSAKHQKLWNGQVKNNNTLLATPGWQAIVKACLPERQLNGDLAVDKAHKRKSIATDLDQGNGLVLESDTETRIILSRLVERLADVPE